MFLGSFVDFRFKITMIIWHFLCNRFAKHDRSVALYFLRMIEQLHGIIKKLFVIVELLFT